MKSSSVNMFTRSAAVGASSSWWMSSRLLAVELLSRVRRRLGAAVLTPASSTAWRRLEVCILSAMMSWCSDEMEGELRSLSRNADGEEEAEELCC